MIASLEPLPLLETVSTRLALLLDASASWVVLLDEPPARLVAARGMPSPRPQDAALYAAELERHAMRQRDAADLAKIAGVGALPWQTLLIIPLALESRLLGGICLASDRPIVLAEDDRRVLLAFAAQAALAMEHAQLFAELRYKQDAFDAHAHVLALSGQTVTAQVERMLQAGAFGFVSKPFVVNELLDAIARGMHEHLLSAA